MKTITLRLPDVEAAMLLELQRKDEEFRDLGKLLSNLIAGRYRLYRRN